MSLRRILVVTSLLSLASCMHVQEVTTSDSVKDVIAAGDLPLVSGDAAKKLIANAKLPVVVMFTADWCKPCQQVKGDFWRSVRKNEHRFLGILVDADHKKEFYDAQGAPPLPAFMVFDQGKPRWQLTGAGTFSELSSVLKENQDGFVHGLTATTARKDPSRVKIFLVAANAEVANFVQEVHDLYKVWLDRGYKDEEIACYWSVPNFGQYWKDRAQFQRMKAFASQCQRANLDLIEKDWKAAAAANPSFLFFYVTAHGIGAQQSAKRKSYAGRGKALTAEQVALPACAQYFLPHVAFDAQTYPKGSADLGAVTMDTYVDRMREACHGEPSRMKLLTQPVMDTMLKAASRTNTVAVVQSCHAGAVIPKSLPAKATMLAAASPERSSFGCGEEGDHTFYGLAFINAMRAKKFDPKVPARWVDVHDAVAQEVELREKELGLAPSQLSQPMVVSGSGS